MAVGIDHIDQLVQMSVANVKKDPNLARLLETGQLKLVTGDGRQGHKSDAPYDAIHVGAAAAQLPEAVRHLSFYLHPLAKLSFSVIHLLFM